MQEKPSWVELKRQVETAASENAELKSRLEKQRQENENYRKLLENVNAVFYVLNQNGRFTYISPNVAAVAGYAREEVIGRHYGDFLHPDHKDGLERHLEEVLAGNHVVTEIQYLTRNGEVLWVRANTGPVFENGELIGAQGVLVDITERKQNERALQESEKRFRTVLENLPCGVFAHDLEGRLVLVNHAASKNTGYSKAQLLTMFVADIDPDSVSRKDRENLWHELQEGHSVTFESTHIRQDGTSYPAEVHLSATTLNGQPIMLAIVLDIGARKQAETELRDTAAILRTAMDCSTAGIAIADADGSLRYVNQAGLAIRGGSESELVRGVGIEDYVPAWQILHTDGTPYAPDEVPLARAVMYGEACEEQFLIRRPDGDRMVWASAAPARDHSGEVIAGIVVFTDITEFKHAEQEIVESEKRYRQLIEKIQVAVVVHGADTRIVTCNPKAQELLGLTEDQMKAKTALDPDWGLLDAEGRELSYAHYPVNRVMATGRPVKDATIGISRPQAADPVWVQVNADPVFDAQGQIEQVIVTFVDLTERKRSEETMSRQQRLINLNNRIARVFLTSGPETLFADVLDVLRKELDSRFGYFGYIDDDGDLVCPSMTREIWSRCEIPDKSIVFPRRDWSGLWGRSLIEQKSMLANQELRLPDGHVMLHNALAVPIVHQEGLIGQFVVADKEGGYSSHDRDLLENVAIQTAPILKVHLDDQRKKEEREKLEAQLRQAQKMEAVGTLAGGIAHDFNNILSSVIGYTELSIDEVPEGSLLAENLSQVLTAGNRAKDLVRQILTLSRKDEQEFTITPVVPLVKEAMKMLRATIPTSIDFREHLSDEHLTVAADSTQLHQVLVNLVTNARDAMSGQEGMIEIRVDRVCLDEQMRRKYPTAKPGDYVRIAVADTGAGMAASHLDRIFEPYYTTKKTGTGTGLGLSVVQSIVERHSGYMQVYSEAGKGSTFEMILPMAEGSHILSRDPESVDQADEPLPEGTAHILLVDDEQPIVKIHQRFLERLGYRVTPRTSSVEALAAFRHNPYKFDILITDMTMPNMTGDRLVLAVKETRPEMPVILCTGFSEKIHADTEQSLQIDGFLMKPVEPAALAKMVRRVLDQAGPAQ